MMWFQRTVVDKPVGDVTLQSYFFIYTNRERFEIHQKATSSVALQHCVWLQWEKATGAFLADKPPAKYHQIRGP